MRVLCKAEGVIGAVERALDVAQQDVDPAGAFHFACLSAAAGFDDSVRMAEFDDRPKGAQTVAEEFCIRRQVSRRPVGQRFRSESRDRLNDGAARTALRVGFHGDHEGSLVLRAAPALAAVALAAEVGIVDLHEAVQAALGLALGHRLHQLVLDPPRAAVADAEMPLELKRRHVVPGLGQDVERKKPRRQRELGVVEHGIRQQAGLLSAAAALPGHLPAAALDAAVPLFRATRAHEAVRPTGLEHRALARGLGAVALQNAGSDRPG